MSEEGANVWTPAGRPEPHCMFPSTPASISPAIAPSLIRWHTVIAVGCLTAVDQWLTVVSAVASTLAPFDLMLTRCLASEMGRQIEYLESIPDTVHASLLSI